MEQALINPTNESLLAENERLRAENERLRSLLWEACGIVYAQMRGWSETNAGELLERINAALAAGGKKE